VLLVCEPVLAEAMHLLARFSRAYDAVFGLLENGALMIAFRIDEHISVLRKLHQKLGQTDVARRRMYCIVMMSARLPGLSVIESPSNPPSMVPSSRTRPVVSLIAERARFLGIAHVAR
jgi:hypothetical protein